MLPYWSLFAFFTLGALFEGAQRRRQVPGLMFIIGGLLIASMIGLRFEVGADWDAYQSMLDYAGYAPLARLLDIGDPGYQMLNWTVAQIEGEIWVVNLICAFIFSWGLFRFARSQPFPWLLVLVAVPYLIIVVAMGYTRQAVAIGIMMAGLAAYRRNESLLRFAAYVAVAALFHRTAVVAFPLVALATQRNRVVNLLIAAAACYLLYDVFLADSLEGFVENYIRRRYSSQGAAVRVAMNTLPAVLFLSFSRRFGFSPAEQKMWRNFALAALALLVLLFVTPSSTAVDRISLYVIPLQLVVMSRVPAAFTQKFFGYVLIALYCFAVLFTWLNYAVHSQYWLPYVWYPLWGA